MQNGELLSDNELILKAQRGDVGSFEKLVHRHDQRVMAIALSHTGNEDDAKDIYQDAFLRIYRGLPKFSFRSEFSTWMYRIVTNVCLTFHARRSKHRQVPFTDIGESADTSNASHPVSDTPHTENVDFSLHIQKGLEALSPAQKMVFTLKHFHGYKIREIATLMNCGEGTVKKHLFIATGRMRKELAYIAVKE